MPKRYLTWLCLVPLLLAAYKTVCFVTDYGMAWQHIEVGNWKPFIAKWGFPTSFSDLLHVFDWKVMEGRVPRLTRPLASLFELYDTPFRMMLWQHMTPLPSFSLTWVLTLWLCPLLLAALLERLGVEPWIILLSLALYLADPGILSLEVHLIRPGKALANFTLLLCLWMAARQDCARRDGTSSALSLNLRFALLCFVTYLGLFTDETALIVYPALFLLFPRLIRRNSLTVILFLAVTVLYAVTAKILLPYLTVRAGYDLPQRYGSEVSLENLLMLRASSANYLAVATNIVFNTLYIVRDFFGLIPPGLPDRLYYRILFVIIVTFMCVGFIWWFGAFAHGDWRKRMGSWRRLFDDTQAALIWRALILSLIGFAYEGILMSVSLDSIMVRSWALYWYGTFCAILLIIALALFMQAMKPPPLPAAVFTCAVVAATTFIFPATNQVYKNAHFYPYHTEILYSYFSNEPGYNRFEVPLSDPVELKTKTEEVRRARDTHQFVANVPLELSYELYELNIFSNPVPCMKPYFDLKWEGKQVMLYCHKTVSDGARS